MRLPSAFTNDDEQHVNVVIETPKGSRNKYAFDPETELFKLKHILPAGTAFPLDFGFIPNTKADDGDPVDVLVLSEQPIESGALLECRLLGVLLAEQQDPGEEAQRNDRLVAVPLASHDYATYQTIDDLGRERINDIVHFFSYYHEMKNGRFTLLGTQGPEQARALIRQQQPQEA